MTITAEISANPIPQHMLDKAARMVADGEVARVGAQTYMVRHYTVGIHNGEVVCSCPSRIRCSHMLAALHVHTEA